MNEIQTIEKEFEILKAKQGLFIKIEKLKKVVDKKLKAYQKDKDKLDSLIKEFSEVNKD